MVSVASLIKIRNLSFIFFVFRLFTREVQRLLCGPSILGSRRKCAGFDIARNFIRCLENKLKLGERRDPRYQYRHDYDWESDFNERAFERIKSALLKSISIADRRDAQGRAAVVRNGYLPEREVLSGIGPVPVKVPRARDRSAEAVRFRSSLVPAYAIAHAQESKPSAGRRLINLPYTTFDDSSGYLRRVL